MLTPIANRPCGQRDCSSSMHRDKYLTFGRGHLSADGHWEYPCAVCARAADSKSLQTLEMTRQALVGGGASPEMVEQYFKETPWLHHAAWPFDEEVGAGTVSAEVLEEATAV